MSVIHPGSSINFDAGALRQDEDEEMRQEELRQQKELRELLSAELSDDLLDDDHSSVNDSHRSLPHDDSTEPQDTVDSPVITNVPTSAWMQGGHNNGGYNGNDPNSMTSTPGNPLQNQYYGQQMNGYEYNGGGPYTHGNYDNGQQYYDPSYGQTSQPQQWHQQQTYGNEMMHQQQRNDGVGQYVHYDQNMGDPDIRGHMMEGEYPFSERGEVEGREDYEPIMDGNGLQQQYIQYKPDRTTPIPSGSITPSPGSKISYRQSYPPQNPQYGRTKSHNQYNTGYDNNSLNDISNGSSAVFEKMERESNIQKKFSTNDGSEESGRQMAQLQILYKARGKKIDDLTRELDALKSDAAREKRILSHQLAMATDQKDGMGTSLEESQRLVQARDRGIEELKGKLEGQHKETESLKSAKNELLNKIQVSERTIESLHEQLTQMSHSEAIERAKEQHDAVLSAATQRHDMQILELTTQLDECRQEMTEKSEEVDKLRFHLNKISRESEQTMLDKTETINRLTKSLEEAQNQCQNLLAGSSENALNRHQMSDLLQERKSNEEEIAYLKMQLRDAEDHLTLYEKALQLGAGGSGKQHHHHTRGGSLSDSLSELMNGRSDVAKKLDWKTPQPKVQNIEPGSQEELIDSLRRELERAITCNKSKRDEVTKLKQQCSELVDESMHWRLRADEAQSQLKMNIPVSGEKQEKGIEEAENDSIRVQELEEKLQNVLDESQRLENICAEVKQRMVEMIQEHDQDKQDAVDRCERACMQLHEDAKQALRDELVSEHEQKMYEMSIEQDAKIREMSLEMEKLQHELDDVKQSYVHICAEKDNIQSSCQQQLLDEFEEEKNELLNEHEKAIKNLEDMLEDLEKQMSEKIKEEKNKYQEEWEVERERIRGELRAEWENEREKIVQETREEWEKERESGFAQQIETKIALAKMNWFEEFSSSKQKQVDSALEEEEKKWEQKLKDLHQEYEEKAKENLCKERKTWNIEKEEELENLRDELLKEKEVAVKTASCIAELNLNFTKSNMAEKDLGKKLQEAQNVWKQEEEQRMKEARESWMKEEKKKIQQAVQDAVKKIEKGRISENTMMEQTIEIIRKNCEQEKQKMLKQKCVEMEDEIGRLQEQHRRDYQLFVEDHKNTLARFMEQEKMKVTSSSTQDASIQVKMLDTEKQEISAKQAAFLAEKEELFRKHKEEIADLRRSHAEKCNELQQEIQRSESRSELQVERTALNGHRDLSRLQIENEKLQGEVEAGESRMIKMKEQNKEDVNRLKERMREEYRRWKRDRASLISKIKESSQPRQITDAEQVESSPSSSCRFCQTSEENNTRLLKHKDEASKQAIMQLSEMYAGTLKLIKDEMMTYINESRGRTKETISRERVRTTNKLKSHYMRAIQRMKPEREIQAQLMQKLKILESDSDSRPDTPIMISQRTSSDQGSKLTENGASAPPSVSGQQYLPQAQFDRIQAWRNNSNLPPTRLTPERGPQAPEGASSSIKPSPHPHSTPSKPPPHISYRNRPTIPATYGDLQLNGVISTPSGGILRPIAGYKSQQNSDHQLATKSDNALRPIQSTYEIRPNDAYTPNYRPNAPTTTEHTPFSSKSDTNQDFTPKFRQFPSNSKYNSQDQAKSNLLSDFQKFSNYQSPNVNSPLGGAYQNQGAYESTPRT